MSNTASNPDLHVAVDADAYWQAYDQFPPPFKAWLSDRPHSYDPVGLLEMWKRGAMLGSIMSAVEQQDRQVTRQTYGAAHPQA